MFSGDCAHAGQQPWDATSPTNPPSQWRAIPDLNMYPAPPRGMRKPPRSLGPALNFRRAPSTSWSEASWRRHLEEASGGGIWMRNHGGDIMEGGIMDEASGGGIMEEASWRRHHGGRHHGGGIWRRHLEEASWMRNHGGDIWRRHHRLSWELSGHSLGLSGSWGGLGVAMGRSGQKKWILYCKTQLK